MINRFSWILKKTAQKCSHGVIPRMATHVEYRQHERWLLNSSRPALKSESGLRYLSELETDGICVVPNYWDTKACEQARGEVDRVIVQHPTYVNGNAKADVRVYGANNASNTIANFADDSLLLSVATAYNREATKTAFTLAARLPAIAGNRGSGEGWHRDAFFRQFKAIIYLTDVGATNGPFQWVRDSHRRVQLLRDMRYGQLGFMQNRMSEAEVAKLLAPDPSRLKTFTASAGTLILVDTSSIHRGMPILEGCRYALTNYYFPKSRIDQSLYDKFDVLPATSSLQSL